MTKGSTRQGVRGRTSPRAAMGRQQQKRMIGANSYLPWSRAPPLGLWSRPPYCCGPPPATQKKQVWIAFVWAGPLAVTCSLTPPLVGYYHTLGNPPPVTPRGCWNKHSYTPANILNLSPTPSQFFLKGHVWGGLHTLSLATHKSVHNFFKSVPWDSTSVCVLEGWGCKADFSFPTTHPSLSKLATKPGKLADCITVSAWHFFNL